MFIIYILSLPTNALTVNLQIENAKDTPIKVQSLEEVAIVC
jgi:hypothetical protein